VEGYEVPCFSARSWIKLCDRHLHRYYGWRNRQRGLGARAGSMPCALARRASYSVYDFIDPTRRQICLAHLARNFQAFAERDGACGAHGQQIRTVIDEVIRADTQARADGATLAWHTAALNDIHNRLMDAVEAGERSHTPDLSRLCATVLDIWPTLWNFTEHSGAEATNNRAERTLRHAVLWRNTSHGTQTEAGDRFVKRILSIRETCRLNQQPLHGYPIDVHAARLAGQPIPTPLIQGLQAA
jgi:transposase